MGIKVLSLFDGISCGMLALQRAGIEVDTYYASEIDEYALKISQHHFPEIIQLGNVEEWQNWNIPWGEIDLLLGGSPCQGFSKVGLELNFNDPRSKLVFEFADILDHIKQYNPHVLFLLENVKMREEWADIISQLVGETYEVYNSALVSAQNRVRYYWFNWESATVQDRKICLKDIIPDAARNKARTVRVKGDGVKWGDKHEWDRANPDRKYTMEELEMLQTLPIKYTDVGGGHGRRCKAIGNCWTVDMIVEILKMI